MKLRFSQPAAHQLDRALADIEQHNAQGALRVQQRIRAVMEMLLRHPLAGRATVRRGVRRIMVSPYPYAITYRVLGLRHTARRPSP